MCIIDKKKKNLFFSFLSERKISGVCLNKILLFFVLTFINFFHKKIRMNISLLFYIAVLTFCLYSISRNRNCVSVGLLT